MEVPEPPGRLFLSSVAVRPEDGFAERATVPEKPPRGATVIVDFAVAPTFNRRMLVELAEMAKSCTRIVTRLEFLTLLAFVARTVTV
jgi:hypothetical protein